VLVLRVTPEEIAAVEARPVESTMVDAGDLLGVKLYRLPNGDFQLWASCNQVEWYSLTFDEVLGPNTGYTSYFYK